MAGEEKETKVISAIDLKKNSKEKARREKAAKKEKQIHNILFGGCE